MKLDSRTALKVEPKRKIFNSNKGGLNDTSFRCVSRLTNERRLCVFTDVEVKETNSNFTN